MVGTSRPGHPARLPGRPWSSRIPHPTLTEQIRTGLAAFGIVPDVDRLDQHLLVDDGVLATMLAAARLEQSDVVVDLGAGPGTFAAAAAPCCRSALAVELDERFVPWLIARRREHPNLSVVVGDLRDVPLARPDVVVASPPFGIFEAVIERLVELAPRRAVLLLGGRAASTAVAKPGDAGFGRNSFLLQCGFDVAYHSGVGKAAFYPQPRRSAGLLVLEAQGDPLARRVARLVIRQPALRVRDLLARIQRSASSVSNPQRRIGELSALDWAELAVLVAEARKE